MTSPGISQWTVNENSFGAQSTQTDNYGNAMHGDSFDSCRDFSMGKPFASSYSFQSSTKPSPSSTTFQVPNIQHRSVNRVVHAAVHRCAAMSAKIVIAAVLKRPKVCIKHRWLHLPSLIVTKLGPHCPIYVRNVPVDVCAIVICVVQIHCVSAIRMAPPRV